MAQEPEVIRQNIEETRSELSRQIECLEQEVVGTVKETKAAVAETVQNVRETMRHDRLGQGRLRYPSANASASVGRGGRVGIRGLRAGQPGAAGDRRTGRPTPPRPPPSPLALPAYQADVSSRPAAQPSHAAVAPCRL